MKMKLYRHATILLTIGGLRIAVDPIFAEQGTLPPIQNSPQPRANPLVALQKGEELLQADALLLTHCHRDHFDDAASNAWPKATPVFCQPDDAAHLREAGFQTVTAVASTVEWNGIRIERTAAQHGHGETAQRMAPSSGYLLECATEPSLYITGDTVWCNEVSETLERKQPQIVIAYAGGATFLNDRPITLDGADMERLFQATGSATLVAVHMETFNHCLLTREELRRRIPDARLAIPADGEEIIF